MTAENNTKYIAEAWIDNKKEEDFKKSFLESLISQLQHHKNPGDGVGFDADMVDGKHYCEIVDEFDEKIQNFMNSFYIGKILFSKDKTNYELGFDGIKLFVQGEDGYTEEERTLPWIENPYAPDAADVPSLLEVFESLYNNISEKLDDKADISDIENLQEFQGALDGIGKNYVNGNLNADTVNGLRFHVINQSDYNALSQAEKDSAYDVYIIKNNDFSIPEDLAYHQPNTAEISAFYEFRVGTRIGEDDEEIQVIEYHHAYEGENVWHYMTDLENFYDEQTVTNLILKLLGDENSAYNLNPNAVVAALKNQNADIGSLPWLYKSDAIRGAFYTDDNSEKIACSVETDTNGFKHIKLDSLKSFLSNKFQNQIETLKGSGYTNQTLKGLSDSIQSLSSRLSSNETAINQVKGSGWKDTQTVSGLSSTLNSVNTKVNKLGTWTHQGYWKEPGVNGWESDLIYNDTLRIAFFQVQIHVNHKGANANKWVSTGKYLPKIPKISFRVPYGPATVLNFNSGDGKIEYYTTYSKNDSNFNLVGGGMYPY